MIGSTVLYEVADGVATISLHRPDVFNAFNDAMSYELIEALQAATNDTAVRCVVLRGAGRAFCSGQDLKEAPGQEGRGSLRDSLKQRYNPMIRLMRDMPKPIIAGINGVAAGAGLSLALAADVRVMVSTARLVEAFAAIALVPDSGATYFYPRMLGYSKAFEFATLNAPLSAEEALRLGLVNQVASPDAFDAALQALAASYAKGPTKSYGFVKKLLQQGMTSSLEQMLEAEEEYQQRAGETEDYSEGIAAFTEKRSPRFKGQ